MQRALVILAMILLVTAALAAGALAAHWPFWARAWQWQRAAEGWPEQLPGPTRVLRGGSVALPLDLRIEALPIEFAESATFIVLLADTGGKGSAFLAPGYSEGSVVEGRGLAAGLLAPLFGLLEARDPGLLDSAAAQYLPRWRDDPRGEITPRQLLWELSGLPAGKHQPLNPFSARAQLASGPDLERAALGWRQTWPAGSHFENSPVNAQVLALLAARHTKRPFAQVLEQELWSQLAAADAVGMLDHLRGDIAAHCCLRAAASDWLRLGLLLADDGQIGSRRLLPAGWIREMSGDSPVHPGQGLGYRLVDDASAGRLLVLETQGRALLIAPALRRAILWIGKGAPPDQLQSWLGAKTAVGSDMAASERFRH